MIVILNPDAILMLFSFNGSPKSLQLMVKNIIIVDHKILVHTVRDRAGELGSDGFTRVCISGCFQHPHDIYSSIQEESHRQETSRAVEDVSYASVQFKHSHERSR